MVDLSTRLGPIPLSSPIVAASGTVGSIYDFADVGALSVYGAAVAKSVSNDPWPGRPPPRIAPAGRGMLNGIGIQNPGIDRWRELMPSPGELPLPVWGSAVGGNPSEFALVAKGLASWGAAAIEVNLSCPNLEDGQMFALDPRSAASVIDAVKASVAVPIGAKLSPNSQDIVAVAAAVTEAGADFVTLTNTVLGMAIDTETRRPRVSGVVGGYSGQPLKPIAMRCVWQVAQAVDIPVVGCGGVATGRDVAEYLLAGAQAVAIGTAHFAEPRVGRRVIDELDAYCRSAGVGAVRQLIGRAQ